MLHSQSIVSLKATQPCLEYLCILPFQRKSRFEVIYYISVFLVYEIVFSTSFYLKFFHTGEACHHAENYDIIYISEHMGWFLVGRIFSLGLILSLCNRSSHQQLIDRMAALDIRLNAVLSVDLSFRQLNIEFIVYSVTSTVYFFSNYVKEGIYHEDNLQSFIYYFCVTIASNFFYIYALYTVYWARVFVNRAEHIINAFKTEISQPNISKQSLTVVMELIKLLFDVHESIQNAFGSTLCIIVVVNSFLIAVSTYGLIDNFQRQSLYFWINYSLWCFAIWIEFIYIIVFFDKIGDVVSIN